MECTNGSCPLARTPLRRVAWHLRSGGGVVALFFVVGALAACGDDAVPSEGMQPGQCSDGADNDSDGDFDCDDSDCRGAPACQDGGTGLDGGTDANPTTDSGSVDTATDGTLEVGPREDGSTEDVGPDVTAVDTGVDSGLPSVCESRFGDAIICDGYEDERDRRLLGTAVDSAAAYRGAASLLASVRDAGDAFLAARYSVDASGPYYARFYLFQPGPYSRSHAPIWFLGADHTIAVITGGAGVTNYFVDRHGGGLDGGSAPVEVPHGSWTCVQVAVTPGDGDGQLIVSYDGTEALNETRMTIPDGLQQVYLGSMAGSDVYEGDPIDIRIDELVVDTRPIPCD